jgi:hypothetical protein
MAIGASGNRIVVLARNIGTNLDSIGRTVFLVNYRLSEPTIDGARQDGLMENTESILSEFEPTDSEIEATLREGLAIRLSEDFFPAEFLSSDIRGLKI